jgi:hypothetical protein
MWGRHLPPLRVPPIVAMRPSNVMAPSSFGTGHNIQNHHINNHCNGGGGGGGGVPFLYKSPTHLAPPPPHPPPPTHLHPSLVTAANGAPVWWNSYPGPSYQQEFPLLPPPNYGFGVRSAYTTAFNNFHSPPFRKRK